MKANLLNKLAFLFVPLLALAACGEEPAAEVAQTQVATPEPTPALPAPDEALFTQLYAETCPEAEPVSTAVCRRAGIGSDEVFCEYGLGEDEYRRNDATLTPGDEQWTLADPENVCAS
ncbi:MAG: hypothetical protein KKE77_05880 [Alphaproteobacteria bacterium]|jgi:hypothetical protein|nr:hypothetical protein [Alphaproteobacteria bacterium]MBU1757134.1 hypothetical protein [Alphaproteobacteria bacterium]MBU2032205.1 hypothetical protein [Alphaproteobacteria bacterium]MBU2340757.1 hypothetical protein [Alphaproteobacteria bacterium]